MITTDKVIFTKEWFDELVRGDDFTKNTPQDIACLLYAAAVYSFTGEKTNIGELFNKESLNRTMSGYYGQIDRILTNGQNQAEKNQKYNNDEIKALAAQGVSQAEICRRLGYDVTKSKSLSSNPGYKEGRKLFLAGKEMGKNSDSCQELAKTSKETFNF